MLLQDSVLQNSGTAATHNAALMPANAERIPCGINADSCVIQYLCISRFCTAGNLTGCCCIEIIHCEAEVYQHLPAARFCRPYRRHITRLGLENIVTVPSGWNSLPFFTCRADYSHSASFNTFCVRKSSTHTILTRSHARCSSVSSWIFVASFDSLMRPIILSIASILFSAAAMASCHAKRLRTSAVKSSLLFTPPDMIFLISDNEKPSAFSSSRAASVCT